MILPKGKTKEELIDLVLWYDKIDSDDSKTEQEKEDIFSKQPFEHYSFYYFVKLACRLELTRERIAAEIDFMNEINSMKGNIKSNLKIF